MFPATLKSDDKSFRVDLRLKLLRCKKKKLRICIQLIILAWLKDDEIRGGGEKIRGINPKNRMRSENIRKKINDNRTCPRPLAKIDLNL